MNNSLFNVPFTENYFHLNELLAATSKGSSLKTSDTVEEKNNKATSSSTSKSEYNKNSSSNDKDNSTKNNSSNTASSQSVNSNIKTYDPFLDNHLRTPARGENHGKFGLPIKDIENDLSNYGAKNHSYAFGKHSRLVLGPYFITLCFDINRRLGIAVIKPKAPLKTIEPKAKDFFIDYFTSGADMEHISIMISEDNLQLKYVE